MDTRHTGEQYISSHLRARERGYIWLERELKRMLLVEACFQSIINGILHDALPVRTNRLQLLDPASEAASQSSRHMKYGEEN